MNKILLLNTENCESKDFISNILLSDYNYKKTKIEFIMPQSNKLCIENDADKVAFFTYADKLILSAQSIINTLAMYKSVILCITYSDNRKKQSIINYARTLEKRLSVPIVVINTYTCYIKKLLKQCTYNNCNSGYAIKYPAKIEAVLQPLSLKISKINCKNINPRWIASELIINDLQIIECICKQLEYDLLNNKEIINAVNNAQQCVSAQEMEYAITCCARLTEEFIFN